MGEETTTEQGTEPTPASKPSLMRRFVIGFVGVVVLAIGFLIGSAVLPRWWAQRVGDVVDGSLVSGNLFGLLIGAVFTFLPLIVLALAVRYRGGWKRAAAFVVLALILMSPNLATIGIVAGSGNAAHAGERILDVDGPGFRGASLVGGIIGAAAALALVMLVRSRRKNKEKASELEAKLESQS